MLVLEGKNINKSYGTDVILKNLNFKVSQGDKVGLVGLNGSGKTTLLEIISKNIDFDSGELYVRNSMKVGYLKQHTKIESDRTIYDEALTVFTHILKMEKDLRRLEGEISEISQSKNQSNLDKVMEEYSKLSEKFNDLNGYAYDSNIKGTLTGLGFSLEDLEKSVNMLSGGQKSRLALAKLLLSGPDILLLDEPTNHLDIEAIDWLARFINDYKGAVILISHDRYFLDMIVNKIFHIENYALKEYRTNYTEFIKRRKENIEIYKRHFEDQQREIAKHKEIIEKYKAYGGERYNRLAKSRQKMLDKIEVMKEHSEEGQIRFKFIPEIESGNDVLEVEDLEKSFGSRQLFQNISFNIYKGDRIGLIGPNGIGKSTLFKIILGEIDDYLGKVKIGHHVYPAYFDQEMSDLNLDKTIIDEIWDDNPKLNHTEIRTILSQFMFIGDDVFKEISDLSGGEKGRLSILKMIMSKANLLLMDEPTNHLDMDSKEVLEDALLDYEGTVFVISHDRYFLNRVANKIFLMTENGIQEFLGNYDYYLEKTTKKNEDDSDDKKSKTKTQIQQEKRKEREILREEKKLKKQIKSVEKSISELEKELSNIDLILADNDIYEDTDKVLEITSTRENIEENLEKLYEELFLLMDEN